MLGVSSSSVILFQSRCAGPGFSGRLLDARGGAGIGGADLTAVGVVDGRLSGLGCVVVVAEAFGAVVRSRDRGGRGLSCVDGVCLSLRDLDP